MKAVVKQKLLAMIIGMALVLPASAEMWGSSPTKLPDPVMFSTRMELGNVEQALAWLDAGLPPDFMGSRTGSGLMIGAWEGKIELMQVFLARGADINLVNANGESPLVLAAWKGNFEAVKWLLERGARVNSPPRTWSALHYAVFAGHKEVADYLMARGANVNALTTNGSSVLMMAIYEGREDIARTLIEKGVNRSVKNDWGDGAMEWAMRNNHLNIARLLDTPEKFNAAVSQPKERWGAPKRSVRSSKELDNLLLAREKLLERGESPDAIDQQIAAERVRVVRADMARTAATSKTVTMEVTASRQSPKEQSAQLVYEEKGKAASNKVPPATYFGTPKMPPKGNTKNY